MLRFASAAVAVTLALFALLPHGAEAKGPVRVVLSGGNLDAPITLDRTFDGREMYGDGIQLDPPLPFSKYVYTVDVYPEGADAGAAETIYYYPAHDGLPAAFRTSYGFFAVMKPFEALLSGVLPSGQADGGASSHWFADRWLVLVLASVSAAAAAATAAVAVMLARRSASHGRTGRPLTP
ncbi:MAG: hypothetical protein HY874_02390 [Chloroflexi bacterium]|nr:hypothetical protein [Chloroflexota bacterium]